ncbi:MAG: helix-turn-helix transcriptional regulator [Planctomycetes bacterium]|nr:helix-turn-helix transcriptional regulator [Planctomycetota bacterium]
MAPRRKSLGDRLRKAASSSGRTTYSLAKGSGLTQSAMYRFMSSECTLSLGSAELLADELDLTIELVPKRGRH